MILICQTHPQARRQQEKVPRADLETSSASHPQACSARHLSAAAIVKRRERPQGEAGSTPHPQDTEVPAQGVKKENAAQTSRETFKKIRHQNRYAQSLPGQSHQNCQARR
jgi:hypothetical protein